MAGTVVVNTPPHVGAHAHSRRRSRFFCLVVVSTACKEGGTITVKALTFKGVNAVDESRLRSVLATKKSSIIPWGKKNYFDRSRFETDLKRIQAFYADRGYPDARVTGFDVKLNDKQDAVELTVTSVGGRADQGRSRRFRRLRRHSGSAPSNTLSEQGPPRRKTIAVIRTSSLLVMPAGSNRMPTKASTKARSGTPYCNPWVTEMANASMIPGGSTSLETWTKSSPGDRRRTHRR